MTKVNDQPLTPEDKAFFEARCAEIVGLPAPSQESMAVQALAGIQAQLDEARAEVERLTKERAEADAEAESLKRQVTEERSRGDSFRRLYDGLAGRLK